MTAAAPDFAEGATIYAVDQQGATFALHTAVEQAAALAAEAGATDLVAFTCVAPSPMTAEQAADYACSHGPAAEVSDAPPVATGDVVGDLSDLASLLNDVAGDYAPDDWEDAVHLLFSLRAVIERLRLTDAHLVRWLYLHGEHGMHQVIDGIPGGVSITRGRSKERWQAPEAVRDYVEARIRANEGEMPDPGEVIGWVLEVLPSGTSVSCKKTALRAAGLDLEDYYASEPGTLQVGLPRATT